MTCGNAYVLKDLVEGVLTANLWRPETRAKQYTTLRNQCIWPQATQ